MQRRRIVGAAAMVTAAGAAVAFTLPSMAGTTPSGRGSAPKAAILAADGLSPHVLEAMQRDLGVNSAQEARARLKKQKWASGATADLRAETGASYAGAWLSKDGTTLNVAVTDAAAADEVSRAGATPKMVERSARELDSAKRALDDSASKSDRGLPGWYVDVTSNKVVVQANPGEADQARSLIADAGLDADSVKIVTTDAKPKPLADVRGADPYFINIDGGTARCSIGFSVEGGFVTAGHCGAPGTTTTGFNQQAQGVVKASVFPGTADMGFVEVNGDFTPRAVVNDFAGNELPVAGNTEAPVGAAVCRSGSTTGTFCGRIIAKNQTVNYPEGAVTGLTQTDVCAEGGDSGGPWLSGDQAQGVTSGGSGDCGANQDNSETFFQPINEILAANNLTLVTTGNGDNGAGAGDNGAGNGDNGAGAGDNGAGNGDNGAGAGDNGAGNGGNGDNGAGAGDNGAGNGGNGDNGAGGDQAAQCTAGAIRQGSLSQAESAQAQPDGGAYSAAAGEQSACLDAPAGADFDLFLQRLTGRGFATVAKSTGTGDKELTFNGTAGTYRYVVSATSGTGDYTLGINVP
jgi:streptogrisin C